MHLALRFSLLVLISASLFVGCQRGKRLPVALQQADGEPLPELRNVAERDDDDVKHPLIRRLLQILDEVEEDGADDERRLIRRTLIDADIELRRFDPQQAIRRANNPYRRRVGRVNPIIRRPPSSRKEAPAKKEPAKKEPAKKEPAKKAAVKKAAVKKAAVKKAAVKKAAVKKAAVKKAATK